MWFASGKTLVWVWEAITDPVILFLPEASVLMCSPEETIEDVLSFDF
jgi:hypothetical protein